MRLRVLFLTALALATLALGVMTAKSSATAMIFGAVKAHSSALQVHCGEPHSLHLARYEDGSAQLKCARHVLVRVSAPG